MILLGLAAALIVLALDQASKWWVLNVLHLPERHEIHVLPHLEFTMVGNRGVTFGLLWQNGDWGPWLLAGMALAVVALLVVWMRRAERRVTAPGARRHRGRRGRQRDRPRQARPRH